MITTNKNYDASAVHCILFGLFILLNNQKCFNYQQGKGRGKIMVVFVLFLQQYVRIFYTVFGGGMSFGRLAMLNILSLNIQVTF